MLCYYGASKAVKSVSYVEKSTNTFAPKMCQFHEYISRALTAQVFRSLSSSTIHILPKNKRYSKSTYVLLPQESMLLQISSFGYLKSKNGLF